MVVLPHSNVRWIVHEMRECKEWIIYSMCLVGVGVEGEWKDTSQRLTAARVALRLRERLKSP